MPTPEQLLAALNTLREDYADDPEDVTYQALHLTFLFVSYRMAEFARFVEEQQGKTT